MTLFAYLSDLSNYTEDERLELIVQACLAGNRLGVIVEKDRPEKVARYIAKVTQNPGVVLLSCTDGPVPGVVMVRFGPKPPSAPDA